MTTEINQPKTRSYFQSERHSNLDFHLCTFKGQPSLEAVQRPDYSYEYGASNPALRPEVPQEVG